jgi:anti-sigma B factor antagonist
VDPATGSGDPKAIMTINPHVKLESAGSDVVIKLLDELDSSAVHAVRDAWIEAVESGARRIHVDMNGVSFIGSAGIGALMYGLTMAEDHGIPADFRNIPRHVYRVLEITGMAEVFTIDHPPTGPVP